MIDYVLRDRRSSERITKLKVGKEIDSDHQSVTVWVDREEDGREKRKKKEIK